MPVTAEELLARKKPVTRTVTIVLDGEVADAWTRAQERVEAAKKGLDKKELQAAEEALEELQPEAEAARIDFVFQAIGRRAYEALVDEHPPSEKDKAEAATRGQVILWDAEAFPPALISASLVDPKLTVADVHEIYGSEQFNAVELAEIFSAAFGVNNTSRVIDLKKD